MRAGSMRADGINASARDRMVCIGRTLGIDARWWRRKEEGVKVMMEDGEMEEWSSRAHGIDARERDR